MSKTKYRKVENERRFWEKIPIRNERDEGCWIWGGPVFRRRRRYVDDVIRPYFYARDEHGVLVKTYANHFAWEMFTGIPIQRGEWLIKLAECNEPLCISPHCHKISDPKDFYTEKYGSKKNKGVSQVSASSEEEFLRRG